MRKNEQKNKEKRMYHHEQGRKVECVKDAQVLTRDTVMQQRERKSSKKVMNCIKRKISVRRYSNYKARAPFSLVDSRFLLTSFPSSVLGFSVLNGHG